MRKRLAILGSTGSVGENAVDVVTRLCGRIEVRGVAGRSQLKRLAEQCRELHCPVAVCADPAKTSELQALLPPGAKALCGQDGLVELATSPEVDMVLCAIVGTAGLIPVIEAIKAGKDIAIASKEILVMAGGLIMGLAKQHHVKVLPVDSEHSAIFQCLEGKKNAEVERLLLTASGGAFRACHPDKLARATFADALAHPTWNMGPKVTVDSATMMNKALEMIEARWLFDIPGGRIHVLIHPQSIVHSLVEFVDGTLLAQLSVPDMRFPIQYALTWPEKVAGGMERLDLAKLGSLTFEEPDRERFPAIDFAYEAMRVGGTLPAAMNAANEVAFERFREGLIPFPRIWDIIAKTMHAHPPILEPSLTDILAADQEARDLAARF